MKKNIAPSYMGGGGTKSLIDFNLQRFAEVSNPYYFNLNQDYTVTAAIEDWSKYMSQIVGLKRYFNAGNTMYVYNKSGSGFSLYPTLGNVGNINFIYSPTVGDTEVLTVAYVCNENYAYYVYLVVKNLVRPNQTIKSMKFCAMDNNDNPEYIIKTTDFTYRSSGLVAGNDIIEAKFLDAGNDYYARLPAIISFTYI